jgi:hypothetical protein
MLTAELRHMDGIKGNFSIVDERDYQATATVKEGDPPDESVLSTARAFVEQQQYIFDMLWHKAIPAKQRIGEIEQGLKREFMDTMQDPYETQKILEKLLESASEEILIILPTITNNRLYKYEQDYLLQSLGKAAEHRVKIRILVNESLKELIEREQLFRKNNSDLVEIQFLDKQQQNKVMTVIVDKELCLTVEVKDGSDDDDSIVEVLGFATYSNSESTVLSYASIFETLRIQAELKINKRTY